MGSVAPRGAEALDAQRRKERGSIRCDAKAVFLVGVGATRNNALAGVKNPVLETLSFVCSAVPAPGLWEEQCTGFGLFRVNH